MLLTNPIFIDYPGREFPAAWLVADSVRLPGGGATIWKDLWVCPGELDTGPHRGMPWVAVHDTFLSPALQILVFGPAAARMGRAKSVSRLLKLLDGVMPRAVYPRGSFFAWLAVYNIEREARLGSRHKR